MKTDFLACLNHFLPFSQTAVNCCQWKQFFSSTGTYFLANPSFRQVKTSFFVYGKQCFFIPSIFLLKKNIAEIWGKSNFKDEPYYCQWTPIFFHFFRYFLKWKPCFCLVKAYFSISYIWLVQMNFLATETVFFFVRAILLLLEIISVIKTQCQFFLLVETFISTKSLFRLEGVVIT